MWPIGALIIAVSATAAVDQAKLRTPSQLNEQAPVAFNTRFDTSKGPFVIETHRDWSPRGADRFYNLVKNGFYDDCRFFRVIAGFLVEFGVHGNPDIQNAWTGAFFPDDPVRQSNKRGFVAFAKSTASHSRSTRIFINLQDNLSMDEGFSPFGRVTEGMDVVDMLHSGYAGEPQKQFTRMLAEGNAFLERTFPKLDYIRTATIVR